jgi:hypothetical protein
MVDVLPNDSLEMPRPEDEDPGSKDLVEGAGELGVSVSDEELTLRNRLTETQDELPCLLGHPDPGGIGGNSGEVTSRVSISMKKST